jgi:hypothetical protein
MGSVIMANVKLSRVTMTELEILLVGEAGEKSLIESVVV